MPSFSRAEVVLVRYPFSDLSAFKVRPAVEVHAPHPSEDTLYRAPHEPHYQLTPRRVRARGVGRRGTQRAERAQAGIYTVHDTLVLKRLGRLSQADADRLDAALRAWLGL